LLGRQRQTQAGLRLSGNSQLDLLGLSPGQKTFSRTDTIFPEVGKEWEPRQTLKANLFPKISKV